MSEDFKCEVCGTEGRRRRMTFVPEGWFYGEAVDDETRQVVVVGVCSAACRERFFKKGPGRMTTAEKEPAEKKPMLPGYEQIEDRSASERMELIARWSQWFYDNTETFSEEVHPRGPGSSSLAMQLAYLFPAMASGKKVECDPDSPLVHILRATGPYKDVGIDPVSESADIWEYIDILTEDGEPG